MSTTSRAGVTDRRGRVPATVLVGPTPVDDAAPRFRDVVGDNFHPGLAARFGELSVAIRQVAERRGVLFADPSAVTRPGDDGMHLTQESRTRMAELIATVVVRALAEAEPV